MSKLIKLKPVQNVVAGQTASLTDIPQGETYEALLLVQGGTTFTKAQMSNIRVVLGGKKILDMPGADMDSINQYFRRLSYANVLPLWFSDPNAETEAERFMGALDTSIGYKDFNLEVDIASTAVAPTLDVWALRSSRLKVGAAKALVNARLKSIQNFAAADEYDVHVGLGSKSGALIKQVHYFTPANAITQVQVFKDAHPLVDRASLSPLQYLEQELTRTIQANLVTVDFMVRNQAADAVPTLREGGALSSFEWKVTLNAADTLRVYSDLFTTVANI